jgi:hypothetical protein
MKLEEAIKSFFAWLKYNGKSYPLKPSIQPNIESGTKVDGIAIIADDIAKVTVINSEINS